MDYDDDLTKYNYFEATDNTRSSYKLGSYNSNDYKLHTEEVDISINEVIEDASKIILSFDEKYVLSIIKKLDLKQLEMLSGHLTKLVIEVQKRLVEKL